MNLKHHNCSLIMMAGAVALVWPDKPALGQTPVIAPLGRNGELVCTNLLAGTTARVEWASSALGPWTNNWAGLDAVTADSNGMIRVSVPMFYRTRGYAVPSNMVSIPAGTFTMGSPDTELGRFPNEGPQTRVTISRGFCLGRCLVTQGEYLAVMGNNPSSHTGDSNLPVDSVSWEMAAAYCAALTAQEHAAGRLPAGHKYRLPTEAEWEYACRAGTTTAFYQGAALRSGMANFDGRYEYPPCGGSPYYCYNGAGVSLGQTTRVGSYLPNPWGLYDMQGNLWQWCLDWWTPALPGGRVTDPQGPETGAEHPCRGGAHYNYARSCRSAIRGRDVPWDTSDILGFRVALVSVP